MDVIIESQVRVLLLTTWEHARWHGDDVSIERVRARLGWTRDTLLKLIAVAVAKGWLLVDTMDSMAAAQRTRLTDSSQGMLGHTAGQVANVYEPPPRRPPLGTMRRLHDPKPELTDRSWQKAAAPAVMTKVAAPPSAEAFARAPLVDR